MSRDHTQEALDEYYTTGIDPTGGLIAGDLDEVEQAFYAEENGAREIPAAEESPWAGIDRLEKLVDDKIAEVDALEKKRAAEKAALIESLKDMSEQEMPTSTGTKVKWGNAIWNLIIIAFSIVMLVMLIIYL